MGETVSKSLRIVTSNPVILVPQALIIIPTILGDIAGGSAFAGFRLLLALVTLVLEALSAGAYPPMVRAILAGATPSVSDAMGKALRKFWSLLVASILFAIIVVLGTIAFIVPGLIFYTWYIYTAPAIMLEDKGALAGLSASKAFGRDKKFKTFLLGIVIGLFFIVALALDTLTSVASVLLGDFVFAVLEAVVIAIFSVAFAYTYITHGPQLSALAAGPEAPPAASQAVRYCSSCGGQIPGESKYCPSCGAPV